uniref:FHA domain-containing protein n=1 Tax=Globodera rostochiensis TaxID=31243 RepID=A0A914I9D8_GLORO
MARLLILIVSTKHNHRQPLSFILSFSLLKKARGMSNVQQQTATGLAAEDEDSADEYVVIQQEEETDSGKSSTKSVSTAMKTESVPSDAQSLTPSVGTLGALADIGDGLDGDKLSVSAVSPRTAMNESSYSQNIFNSSIFGSFDARVRRSTRDIKRPKFDDELVESVQIVQPKPTPRRRQLNEKANGNGPVNATENDYRRKKPMKKSVQTPNIEERAASTCAALSIESFKRWNVDDDIALIAAVTHVSDLNVVYNQMKFSKRYSLAEIEERWYDLLYDEQTSNLARKRMEQITKEKIRAIQSKIPFSHEEEHLIRKIPAVVQQNLVQLHIEQLLEQNQHIFHHARTVKVVEEHWRELKNVRLLIDQSPQRDDNQEENLLERIYDLGSLVGIDPSDQFPLDVEERQFARSALVAEREMNDWQNVFVSAITGIPASLPNMSPNSMGILFGKTTTYDIRDDKVLIGRSTGNHAVPVDLTLDGPTARVSRKQAFLKMTDNGECTIRNLGRRPIYVNGLPLLENEATILPQNSTIEIAKMKLKFMKNENYQREVQQNRAFGNRQLNLIRNQNNTML